MILSTKSIIRRTFSPFNSCAGHKNISKAFDSMAVLERPAGETKNGTSPGRVGKGQTGVPRSLGFVGCIEFSGSRRPSSGVLTSWRESRLRSLMDSICSWSCQSAATGHVADVILAHFFLMCLHKAIFFSALTTPRTGTKPPLHFLMPLFCLSPKVAGSMSDCGA